MKGKKLIIGLLGILAVAIIGYSALYQKGLFKREITGPVTEAEGVVVDCAATTVHLYDEYNFLTEVRSYIVIRDKDGKEWGGLTPVQPSGEYNMAAEKMGCYVRLKIAYEPITRSNVIVGLEEIDPN